MKYATSGLCAAALLLAGGSAAADGPGNVGQKGQIFISAERLFGLNFYSGHFDNGSESSTQLGLLWNNSTSGNTGPNPYTVPRLALDVAIIPNLTLGGSIGYASTSGQQNINGAPQVDFPDRSLFAFTPRVGYIIGFNQTVGVWLRGGLTYYNMKVGDDDSSGLGLDLEAAFLFTIFDHFGFSAAPVLDVPLTGSVSHRVAPSDGYKILNVGVNAGLYTYF